MDSNRGSLYYIRALLALAALLAFMYLYGQAIIDVIRDPSATPYYSDAYIYVATALAGLVGGVAATSLGQTLPAQYTLRRRFNLLGRVLAPFQPEDIQNALALAYTIIYILYGFVALGVWITAKETSHQAVILIRDLGLVFIGLLLATAQAFFVAPDSGMPTHPPEVPARRSGQVSGGRAAGKPKRRK